MHVVLIPRLLKLDQIRNNEKNKEKENWKKEKKIHFFLNLFSFPFSDLIQFRDWNTISCASHMLELTLIQWKPKFN